MKTILLVEDDDQLSRACAQVLSRAGYSVIPANDGNVAVATLETAQVDLLVVDMFLPGKDGYEVIDACRRLRPTLPILGMSGGGDVTDPHSLLHGARELGAVVTIAKPFSAEELLSVVDQVLAPRRNSPARERWSPLDLIRRPKNR